MVRVARHRKESGISCRFRPDCAAEKEDGGRNSSALPGTAVPSFLRRFARIFLLISVFLPPLFAGEEITADPLLAAARKGDVSAQMRLADEYLFGKNNRSANSALGFFWLHKAAQNGNPAAQYNLGLCYEKGWGVAPSRRIAYHWFEKAAAQGFTEAMTRRAELLYRGTESAKIGDIEYAAIPADPERALNMLRYLQDHSADAQLILIKFLFMDTPKHEKELRKTLAAYCERKNADSEGMILYAACLRSGIGGAPDPESGARWIERAAKAENPEAIAQLAEIYDLGSGLPADRKKALVLAEKAAELNSPRAQLFLGNRYLSGDGVPVDYEKAFQFFSRAAANKYSPGICAQGDCYALGAGVIRDERKAMDCYEKAADAGDVLAKRRIAYCYREGRGVPVSSTLACYWFEQAATAGDVISMREAGLAYWNGDGVRRDPARARQLLDAAAKAGDHIARETFVVEE